MFKEKLKLGALICILKLFFSIEKYLVRFKKINYPKGQFILSLWHGHQCAVYTVKDKEEGIELAERLIKHGGLGHSAVIHSEDRETILEFSERYTSFDFIVEDVYKGKRFDDTAITGIFVDALDLYKN